MASKVTFDSHNPRGSLFLKFSMKGLAGDQLDVCIPLTGNFKDRIFKVGGQPSAAKEIVQKDNRH